MPQYSALVATVIALLIYPSTVSAAPLYRLTLEGQLTSLIGPEGCTTPVCLDPLDDSSWTAELIIDAVTVDRRFDEFGVETVEASYHFSEWSFTQTTGVMSLFPAFQDGIDTSGNGSSNWSPGNQGGCCHALRFSYDDGVNWIRIGSTGDIGNLDPWYRSVAVGRDAFVDIRTPGTGGLSYFGNMAITEIAPVPEPSSLFLVSCVLGAAGVRRLRRSRARPR